jgi:hypothetical protein
VVDFFVFSVFAVVYWMVGSALLLTAFAGLISLAWLTIREVRYVWQVRFAKPS